jgi:PTH2 family peptidyl-tRNA hydrolase
MEENKDRHVKQIILMRSDLKMRRGKEISQGCHASLGAVLNLAKFESVLNVTKIGDVPLHKLGSRRILDIEADSYLDKWINGIFTKITLKVESLEQLKALFDEAKANGMPGVLITDVGLTKFNGVPTVTCASIGPYWSDEIDKITKDLKLY